jgi:hypothetical protein
MLDSVLDDCSQFESIWKSGIGSNIDPQQGQMIAVRSV